MDISAGLIAKGTAGALAASAAVGGGVMAGTNGWFDGLFPNSDISRDIAADEQASDVEVQGRSDSHLGVPETSLTVNNPSGDNAQGEAGAPSTPPTNPHANTDQSIPNSDGSGSTNEPNNDSETAQSRTQDSDDDADDTSEDHHDSEEESESEQEAKPTKWDNGLIDYLKNADSSKNRDITFTVKTGKNADKTLSTDFPDFEDGEVNGKQKSIVTVTVTTSNASLKGTDANEEIQKLKAMNKNGEEGQDWTWECKIIFSKDKKRNDNFDFENKEKLFGNEGFFNKLMANGEKELKIKFIEKCAGSRDSTKYAEYEGKTSLDDAKITSEKTFELKKDNSSKKLKIKHKDFKEWFSTTARNKQQHTPAS